MTFRRRSGGILAWPPPLNEYAFSGCKRLQVVKLTSLASLRIIGPYCFDECESLPSINIESLPRLQSIEDSAFRCCLLLRHVNFSDLPSLRAIGPYAFSGCKSLQSVCSVNLSGLEYVGIGCFQGCTRLPAGTIFASRSPCSQDSKPGATQKARYRQRKVDVPPSVPQSKQVEKKKKVAAGTS